MHETRLYFLLSGLPFSRVCSRSIDSIILEMSLYARTKSGHGVPTNVLLGCPPASYCLIGVSFRSALFLALIGLFPQGYIASFATWANGIAMHSATASMMLATSAFMFSPLGGRSFLDVGVRLLSECLSRFISSALPNRVTLACPISNSCLI